MKKLIILFGLMLMAVAAFGQNNFKYPIVVGTNGGTGGYLKLNGATSGSVTLLVPAVAGTTTIQFPTTLGTSGYVLTTNGAGVLSWAVGGTGGGGMIYPTNSGIPIIVGGTAWGTTITNNSNNWNTAYGWGSHASAGYANAANAVFTGSFTMPSPFTLGATSVTTTGTQLNLLNEATDIINYSITNYSTTGTGNIVLSTGATMTAVNITDVIKLVPLGTAPSGPAKGWIYMNTNNHLYVYSGTAWVQIDN